MFARKRELVRESLPLAKHHVNGSGTPVTQGVTCPILAAFC
jgi:hypothetical protein